jgi:hypothetical protein
MGKAIELKLRKQTEREWSVQSDLIAFYAED